MVDDTQGRDTTADSVMYNPGDTQARDVSGNFVDIPTPIRGPSVDKEELTDDSGETEALVEQQEENLETGENNDPSATDSTDNEDSTNDDSGVATG